MPIMIIISCMGGKQNTGVFVVNKSHSFWATFRCWMSSLAGYWWQPGLLGIKKNHPDAHGLSYGRVGPSYGGVWGLKSLGFEGPRAVWSVWAHEHFRGSSAAKAGS